MQVGNATQSIGFQTMKFTISEITNGMAYGVDNFNRPKKVSATLLPSKGPTPQPGETWIISKAVNGVWSFSMILNNPAPPVITGAQDNGTALACLLAYMDSMGYIVDNTTPTSRAASDSLPAEDTLSTS